MFKRNGIEVKPKEVIYPSPPDNGHDWENSGSGYIESWFCKRCKHWWFGGKDFTYQNYKNDLELFTCDEIILKDTLL
jgi:hypothetical protein